MSNFTSDRKSSIVVLQSFNAFFFQIFYTIEDIWVGL